MKEEYKTIAAFEAEDFLPQRARLVEDSSFKQFLDNTCHTLLKDTVSANQILKQVSKPQNLKDWDLTVFNPLMYWIISNTSAGIELLNKENLSKKAVYITNHRDILLDSTLLSILVAKELGERPYIGIGTNLYVQSWIEPLVRLNKAFSIHRGGMPRELLRNSQLLSAYIYDLVVRNENSIWIAQREGRAKNSDDRTQPALLKMLTMAGEGDFLSKIECLNLTPISLSYEYDPCDYLKAQEMQLKRDNADYKKTPQDDYLNMYTGITGYKGKIIFTVTPSINPDLKEISKQTEQKNEQAELVAKLVDTHIHSNYHIFNVNKIAYDMLLQTNKFCGEYTENEKQRFEEYIENQLGKIQIENKDSQFLRQRILEMYANPLINFLESKMVK